MAPRSLVVALVLCLALAGCAGLEAVEGPSDGPTGTDSLAPGEGTAATVVTVVDGDTVEVRFANGTTDTVRLLGIDTPETHGENSPDEYEGVPDTDAGRACLRDAGQYVTSAVVVPRLEGERVRLVRDPAADRRGYYDRRLSYVVHDGTNVNELLVAEGWARVYDTTFTRSDRFYAAETSAMNASRGLWACRDGAAPTDWTATTASDGLTLVRAHADADGPDGENLTDEYLVFENRGDGSFSLGGWTVSDEAGHRYTFPEGATLDPGASLRLVTGSGSDGDGSLYWGASSPIWNNDGDVVRVRDRNGTLRLEHTY